MRTEFGQRNDRLWTENEEERQNRNRRPTRAEVHYPFAEFDDAIEEDGAIHAARRLP